ncbi:hypothetical protein BGZ98_000994 [Dissophora globulifera]|nr:hypothetical protein BGZ98_000994 [Dissophora globulifera]
MTSLISSRLSLIFLFLCLLVSVLAQGQNPSPSPDPASVSPSPSPNPGVSPTATTVAATPTPSSEPDPIFSDTDSCNACKPQYAAVHSCSDRVPITGNLTVINQALPFYQCVCPNNGVLIDALQECSICLRSTGQQNRINRAFYNVTNQEVKAIKQVCLDTDGGVKVPSGAAGRWAMLSSAASWGAVTAAVLILLPLGGL